MECSPLTKSKEDSNNVLSSSSCRDWTEMPLGVLGNITKALPYIDRCRFRAVCHRWNEAASSIMRKCRTNCSGGDVDVKKEVEVDVAKLHINYDPFGGHLRSPWLMLPVRKEKGTHHGFCTLAKAATSSSTDSSNYFFRLNHLPSIGHIAGTSPGGWILHVDDYGELHALNIFTLVEIDAPPVATFSGLREICRDDQGRVTSYVYRCRVDPGDVIQREQKVPFYSQALIFFFPPPPTRNGGISYCCGENKKDDPKRSRVRQGRYLFVVIRELYDELSYAWEGDQSWTDVVPQYHYFFRNLLLHNGLIYVIACGCPDHLPAPYDFGFVAFFDPTIGSESFQILDAPFYHNRGRILMSRQEIFQIYADCYIIEISGELWVVSKRSWPVEYNKQERMKQRGRNGRRGFFLPEIFLFKLDKEANQWIEIHDGFGEGHALFLGTNQSLALLTSEFSHLKSGCIYFTDNYWDHCSLDRGVGVFDLKTKTFHLDCHWRPKGNSFPPPVWLLR